MTEFDLKMREQAMRALGAWDPTGGQSRAIERSIRSFHYGEQRDGVRSTPSTRSVVELSASRPPR